MTSMLTDEAARERDLEQARARFPEGKLADFDVRQRTDGRAVLTDKATGTEYITVPDPLVGGDLDRDAADLFVVSDGRPVYLRVRGRQRQPRSSTLVATVTIPATNGKVDPTRPVVPYYEPPPTLEQRVAQLEAKVAALEGTA